MAKFERILETATDGIVTLDKEGRYTYANPAAESILGVPRGQILQRTFDHAAWKLSTLKGERLPNDETPFKRVLQENKGVYGLKLIIERPDGERVIISTNAAPLFDAAGHFDGVVGVFTDVTEQHELQERNKTFHHTVAHDLRIPLTVIQGHAEMLKDALREGGVRGTILQNVDGILEGTEKMERMIQDLVDTARIEGGQVHLEKESINLETFVWSLLQRSQEIIDMNRLITQIPQNLPSVSADPGRLERIFLNLLSNSAKFSPPESKVIIQARKVGGEIIISITDHGMGITPEDCSRLFKRFFQVRDSQASSGVGLGLYIAKLLVETHGGHIWVESKLGEGSTFYFSLPAENSTF
ncbi:PAS domain-containing sensor histidine kinase [Desulfuromonas versatilis]|uniref:PAS domain-containing sensor histidine kinase n=1 Tax=Desulfuromonas versatilis TaxID=2802975 RepID=UPI001C865D5D|nr:ATP-binding protein [Desulfuromonas versatilis]